MKRLAVVAGWTGSMLLALVLGGWAGMQVSQPTITKIATPESTFFTVSTGTVGSSITLPVQATWPSKALPPVGSSGVLTRMQIPKDGVVHQGDTPYSVDERPVAVFEGSVPMFRQLQEGDAGLDVMQ